MATLAASGERATPVAEGIHAVATEDEELHLTAREPLNVVVRSPEGELLDARQMETGDAHTYLLDEERVFLALQGGAADIEAEGPVSAIEPHPDRVPLIEGEASPVDRSISVQVPEDALLAQATLDAVEAQDLEVQISADDRSVMAVGGEELADGVPLAPSAIEARSLDVAVEAEGFEGELALTFLTIDETDRSRVSEEQADAEEAGYNASIPVSNVHYEPIAFTVPGEEPGQLTIDVDTGYMLDASLYDAEGTQLHHVHVGEPIEEHREECWDVLACPAQQGYQRSQVAPQSIEHAIEPGEHVLFVREGAVEATLEIVDSQGDPILPQAESLDVTVLEVASDRELETDVPLLDIWRTNFQQDAYVDRSFVAELGNGTVFTHESLVQAAGSEVASETTMDPANYEAGDLSLVFDSLAPEQAHQSPKPVSLVLLER